MALCDLNTSGLAGVAATMQEADGQARVVELDVSNQEQATRAMDSIVQAWGRLDVLVNAAGIASAGQTSRGPVLNISELDWDRIMDVNLLGTVYCAQAAARAYDATAFWPHRQHRLHCWGDSAAQCCGLWGLESRCAHVHEVPRHWSWRLTGSRSTPSLLGLLIPRCWDATETAARIAQMRERFIAGMPEIFRLGVPLGKLGKPEDVASAILYLASDEAHHVTGVIFNVDGMAQLS